MLMRFFVESKEITEDTIVLSAEDSKHIRSLRLRPDEIFVVCDSAGIDYICRLGAREDSTVAKIIERRRSIGEPTIACTVYIAYAKGERLDYAVQKSVELGAHEIVLYKAKRCVAVPNNIPKKIERLQKIALETAKQCDRGIVPKVADGGEFETILSAAAKNSDLSLLCYESEKKLHLKEVLDRHLSPPYENEANDVKSIAIITGPEGGFESSEVELTQSKGIQIVSLGPRILRSETAPVVALTAIMYHTENL